MPGHTEGSGAKQNTRSGVDRRAVKRSVVDRRRVRRVRNRICGALLAVVLVGTATVYGCNSDRIAGPSPSPTKAAAPDLLVVSTPEQQQATPTEFPDPCTGEIVQGTQTERYVFDVDDQTPHITLHMRFRVEGNGVRDVLNPITGIVSRQLTGTTYRGSGEHNEEFNDNLNAEKFEATVVDNYRIFATNSLNEAADDFSMHTNTHITMFFIPFRATAEVTNAPPFECK
jgi:hypothetical protein